MTNSSRLYPNYYRMASKRLSSCSHMLELYKTDATRQEVLHDIYYLSGYILEGFIIYSIYKIYEWNEDTPIDDYKGMEGREINQFFSRTKLRFYNDNRSGQRYSIQGHNFQKNVELLKNQPHFSRVPFFSNTPLKPPIDNLVNNWNPEIRYMFDCIPLSTEKLEQLLDFCSKVKNHIINVLGVDPE